MSGKNARDSLDALLQIMQTLRAPQGCPWDAQQTPESLAPYILEEACELIDAVETGMPERILDELGDLLLQVVFQAQIFNERQQFDFYDVAAGIGDKLVRRHPHVFSDTNRGAGAEELAKQWDKIKSAESTHNKTCLADHLPGKLPALQRAQKLIARAYRADRQTELPEVSGPIFPETGVTNFRLEDRLDEEAFGLALFRMVRLAQECNLDAETALRKMTGKIARQLDTQ